MISFSPTSLALLAVTFFVTSCGFHEYKTKTSDVSAAEKATFKWIKANIIDVQCISCHAPGKKAERCPMTKYQEIKTSEMMGSTPEESLLYTLVDAAQMPPRQPRLAQDQVQAIYDWLKGGALNN